MTQRHGPAATPRAVSDAGGPDPGSPDLLFHLAWVNQVLHADAERSRVGDHEVASFHDDILANIGHELRTPLTIIQGLSEILLDDATGVLPSQYCDFLKQIHQASRKLGQLAETSIMLTKLNSGYLKIHPIPIQLDEAISRVVGQYHEELEAKQLAVAMEISPQLPLVWADGLCLEIALQALLDNAIKFNVEGGRISWSARAEAERVCLAVTDTGVGIPPAKLPALFAVFGQLESGTTRRFGGLGLGLPLVKKLIASMGGDIVADSPGSNMGSTFTLALPRVQGDVLFGH
jgi:signal transduction histidine kinase